MSNKTILTVMLTQKADVKQVRLPSNEIKMPDIAKIFKKKEVPELLGTYPSKQLTLFLFGYTTGRTGNENKHELPPPFDETVVFGDILILASKNKMSFSQPVTFKAEDYENFYKRQFGDFGDDDSEEEEDSSESEEELVPEEEVPVDEDFPEEEEEEQVPEIAEEAEEEVVVPRVVRKRKTDAVVAIPIDMTFNPEDKLLPENSETAMTTQKLRLAMIAKMKRLFGGNFSEPEIVATERAIFNNTCYRAEALRIPVFWKHPMFQEIYRTRARQIVANLSADSYVKNDELVGLIKSGQVPIDSLATLDTYQLFPSKWKAAFEFQQMKEKRQLEGNKSMATDKFTCGRCWKKECTYYEMQTRSADEPMTIFITCLNCGKHWRQ
jgi:transcription elongation factor S-II